MNSVASVALDAIKSTLNQEEWDEFSRVCWQKYQEAMRYWAMVKMGKDHERYLAMAWEDFLTNLGESRVQAALESGEFFDYLQKIVFVIPKSLRKKDLSLFGKYTAAEIMSAYESTFNLVKDVKRKKWRNPASLEATLAERLPGLSRSEIGRIQNRKPSQIARAYIVYKYKLPFDHESLKKRLALAKSEKKQRERLTADLFKRMRSSLSMGLAEASRRRLQP
jgi:hypothetical protein